MFSFQSFQIYYFIIRKEKEGQAKVDWFCLEKCHIVLYIEYHCIAKLLSLFLIYLYFMDPLDVTHWNTIYLSFFDTSISAPF